jgi:hypothetical protein
MQPAFHHEITQLTPREAPSYAEVGRKPPAFSNQPSRSREPHHANNPSTAVPAAAPMTQSRPVTTTTKHRDSDGTPSETRSQGGQVSSGRNTKIVLVILTSSRPQQSDAGADRAQDVSAPSTSSSGSSSVPTSKGVPPSSLNLPPTRASQETGSDAPFGLAGGKELGPEDQIPLPQAHSSHGRKTTKPHAQKVDRTTSVQLSPQPSTHSAPVSNQPTVSASSSPSRVASSIGKTASNRVPMPCGVLAGESHRDTRSGLAASESPTPGDKDKPRAGPSDQTHINPSASSRRPPLLTEYAVSAVGSPSRSQPVSEPLSLSTSRFQRGNEGGIESEAKRVVNIALRKHRLSGGFLSTSSVNPVLSSSPWLRALDARPLCP